MSGAIETRRPASFWRGHCSNCQRFGDLAYRPGTIVKICARCMWPRDHGRRVK